MEPLITAAVTLDPIHLKPQLKIFYIKNEQLSQRNTGKADLLDWKGVPRRPLALCTTVQHTVSSPPLSLTEQGQTLCARGNMSSWTLRSFLCFSWASFYETSWLSHCAASRSFLYVV